MADSTRKRSRAACISCQSRKRKCSGDQPCTTCAQAGVDCQYSTARKKRVRSESFYRNSLSALDERRIHDGMPSNNTIPKPMSAAGGPPSPTSYRRLNDTGGSQSLEANSGAAFVRKLGLRIDPARAPRLHLFAWNVGERHVSPTLSSSPITPSAPAPITKIISLEEMRRLAAIYFEKVDPCYAFLDRKTVLARIAERWSASAGPAGEMPEQPYDSVLCGVAAFGFLFSRREILLTERLLVDTAHLSLEKTVTCPQPPSVDAVVGWVLRAAYLRMTASPHAAWMASCTLMHLVEAAGLHLDASDPEATGLLAGPSSTIHESANSATIPNEPTSDPGIRRRLFGMARHLNTWISFDLGRSRVVLHGATSQAPTSHVTPLPPSTTSKSRADLFHVLPLSESLDPTGPAPQDLAELETALTSVLELIYTEPSLILVQCNLMLCIYRRVRALNAHAPLSGHLLDRILALASRGLRAARQMVALTCPWHQVANVPFQVVCTLLAIDNRAALDLLPDAMQTLREVLAAYDTSVMREAYSTAYLLIAMHQRRKEDDTRALAEVLRANAAAMTTESEVTRETSFPEKIDTIPVEVSAAPVSNAEISWLEDLVIDMPSLQNFDLDQFLLTDVPWPLPEMGI